MANLEWVSNLHTTVLIQCFNCIIQWLHRHFWPPWIFIKSVVTTPWLNSSDNVSCLAFVTVWHILTPWKTLPYSKKLCLKPIDNWQTHRGLVGGGRSNVEPFREFVYWLIKSNVPISRYSPNKPSFSSKSKSSSHRGLTSLPVIPIFLFFMYFFISLYKTQR